MDRRFFLKLLTLGACSPFFLHGGAVKKDENLVAILSDTHVGPGAPGRENTGFQRSVESVLRMNPLPANVLILGDVAYGAGLHEDYEFMKKLIHPLERAGIKWQVCMGNHDRRKAFSAVFPEHAYSLFPGHIVSLVSTPWADFLLLDSLVEGRAGGALGAGQEAWLKAFLKKRTKKVFVCAHHSILELKLDRLLSQYPCVAGFLNGHHHHWYRMLNFFGVQSWVLPSTGHWGDIGFTVMKLQSKKATLRLLLHDVYPLGKMAPEIRESVRLKRLQQLKSGPLEGCFIL